MTENLPIDTPDFTPNPLTISNHKFTIDLINLSILAISYKQNHKIHSPLRPTSFTKHVISSIAQFLFHSSC